MEREMGMGHNGATTSVSGSLGYPREVVDDFMAALEAERARLTRLIEEAEGRAVRARMAISNHEVMLTMLVEAHARLVEREHGAQLEAAEILESADREARALLDEARGRDPRWSPPKARGTDAPNDATHIIDLVSEQLGDAGSGPLPLADEPVSSLVDANAVHSFSLTNGNAPTGDGDRYFDFLRGALADDHPLGPRGD